MKLSPLRDRRALNKQHRSPIRCRPVRRSLSFSISEDEQQFLNHHSGGKQGQTPDVDWENPVISNGGMNVTGEKKTKKQTFSCSSLTLVHGTSLHSCKQGRFSLSRQESPSRRRWTTPARCSTQDWSSSWWWWPGAPYERSTPRTTSPFCVCAPKRTRSWSLQVRETTLSQGMFEMSSS